MWVIDAHQLFYIDETGALCHAMSGLAVDVLGIYFFTYDYLPIS